MRKRRRILPFLLGIFVLCTGCQINGEEAERWEPGSVIQDLAEKIQEFSHGESGNKGSASGHIISVKEELPVSDVAQAKEAAIALGLCEGASLEEAEAVLKERFAAESDGVVCYRMDQMYQGIPVYRHGVSVVTDEQGIADLAAGNYVDVGAVDTVPGLDEDKLSQAVSRYTEDTEFLYFEQDEETPLVIFVEEDGDAHLAYLGYIKTGDQGLRVRELLIDAESGEILSDMDLASEAESGEQIKLEYAFYPENHNVKIQHWFSLKNESGGSPYLMQDLQRGLYLYEGMDGKSFGKSGMLDVAAYSTEAIERIISKNQKPEVRGIQAYVMASMSYDFFQEVLGRHGFDDKNGVTRILYDSGLNGGADRINPWNAKSWVEDGDSGVIAAGIWAKTEDWNLIGHEYTHLVTQYFLGNYGGNSVMEGYSDGFAEMMEAYFSGEDPDWVNTPTGRKLRPENGKGKEGSQIYTYSYMKDNTECHDGGTILTNVLGQIWNSWRKQEGMNVDTAVKKLSMLLYRSLFLLNDPAEYVDFAEAMDATAQAMERQGQISSAQAEDVRSALLRAEIPFSTSSSEDIREAEDAVSLCSIQVLDGVSHNPVEGARVTLLWQTFFADLPLDSYTTDSLGCCIIDGDPYLHKRKIRISAEGYQELEGLGAQLETYLRPEEQTGEEEYEAVNIFFLYPEDYGGGEIQAEPSKEPEEEENARRESLLRELFSSLSERYGLVNTEEDYLASGTPGIISQAVVPERLTGMLCGQISDYDEDGAPELLTLRADGTGYEEGASNHLTYVDLYLSVYESEGEEAAVAAEKKIRIPGLPDTECSASFQLFTAKRPGGETIYLDYMLNQNAQCYGILAFQYKDGVLEISGGIENTEWPSFSGAYVSDILTEDEGLLYLCRRIYREEGTDPSGEDRPGWTEGNVYDWTWTEDPSGAGMADLDGYRSSMESVLEEMGLEAIESRSYLDASSITMEWIEQSCCRRPAQGYACPDGEIRELGGMFSCCVDLGGPGIAFTCYGKQEP